MLHIVLMILKIIGIILAIIIGLVLVAVGIVLFVPVRYRVDGELDNAVKKREVQVRFFWFFHLLSGYAKYEEDTFSWRVRFFWKKWNCAEDVQEVPEIEIENTSQGEREDTATQEKREDTAQEKHRTDAVKRTAKKRKKEKKYTFQKLYDKIKAIKTKKDAVFEFLQDEKHRKAFSIVKREVFRLWRVIKPRTLQMKLHFGFEDPYVTGNVLAALSVLYPWYGDCVEIIPDFEEVVLEGNAHIKGRLHLLWVVVIIWNLYFNDCVMNTYRDLKKLGDEA